MTPGTFSVPKTSNKPEKKERKENFIYIKGSLQSCIFLGIISIRQNVGRVGYV